MWDHNTDCKHIDQLNSPSTGLSALEPPGRSEEFRNRARQRDTDFTPEGHDRELRQAPAPRQDHHHRLADSHQALLCAPVLDPETSAFIRPDHCASKYVPVNWRIVSRDENEAGRIAWGLEVGAENAIQLAAPGMAALIDGPCWLVPVPASDGSLTANLKLAGAIAALVPGARVKCALARAHPVESSCNRRLDGHFDPTVPQHAIVRTTGPMQAMPVYFVDNVITTGTTIAACRRALGWGTGLAYANGSTCRNTRSRP